VVTAVNNDNILSPNDGRTAASGKREAEQPTTGSSNQGGTESTTTQATKRSEGAVDVTRASQLYSQAELSPPAEGSIDTTQQAEALAATINQQFKDDPGGALRSQGGVSSTTPATLLENAPT
jgi:hypothetical protein